MKVIKKVAFMVHEPALFAHYSSVWAEMERDSFVILLMGVFSSNVLFLLPPVSLR